MRRIVAVVLLAVSVLLAPVAVLGAWARANLLDTDRFVEIFAPLATQPDVQDLVADAATESITGALPIESLIADLFDGIATLPIPPRTGSAIQQLQPIAVAGVNSLVRDQVERLVQSPQFAQIWEATLRESHAHTISVLDGDHAVLQLDDDGALSLLIGPIVAEVRERLIAQDIAIARLIPEVDHSVEIVGSEALVGFRAVYRIANVAGYWLPFVVTGLAVVGIVVARDRLRALAWAGVAFASSFVVLGVARVFARGFVVGAARPSSLPEETAGLMFDHFTAALMESTRWLLAVSLTIAVVAATTLLLRRRSAAPSGDE